MSARPVIASFALVAACASRHPSDAHCADAGPVDVPTADGAMVTLHHHPAAGPPVLVVHGVASNARFWDLSPERSIAVALNNAGYDAWLLDLRGHGEATHDAAGRRQRQGWSIDAYGRHDLPAAIQHIRTTTGYERVGYIGHSMGGMAAAVYTAWHGDSHLAALAVLGSPLDFRHPDPLLQAGRRLMAMGRMFGQVPVPALARLSAPVRDLPLHADDLLFASANMDESTREAMYRRGTAPLSRGELKQLQQTIQRGAFLSVDGSRDYTRALSDVDVPLLVIAGRADHIAPPDRVRPWVEHAGSVDKTFEVLGEANGFSHDYGHLDMAVGIDAPSEVHPILMGFLDGRWSDPRP